VEESQNILNHFIEGKHVFALEYEGHVIGSLGVERYNEEYYPQFSNLMGRELGYVLSKDYWGRGLMPEAVKAVIAWLFEREKLDFIMVGHFTHNHRSRRVIEKCGFSYIETTKFETRFHTVEDSMDYIMFRPERGDNEC